MNNRFGPALTPFIEPNTVAAALKIPLQRKNFGQIEAEMINRLNPKLAAFNSVYGHNFVEKPTLKRRMIGWANHNRPPFLRRYTYRIKSRRLQTISQKTLNSAYVSKVIGADYPYMRSFFNIESINDGPVLNRVCTLELLCQLFQPSIRNME